MKTEQMIVTPELASVWLEKNKDNRNVRKSWVKKLTEMIQRGEWDLTHQGIAFSKSGRLLDGQHRLLAIVEADQACEMLVSTGLDESAFKSLDVGAKRSFSDMTGADTKSAAVSSFIGYILWDTFSPAQQMKIHKITSPVLAELLDYCPSMHKGTTSCPVHTAAVVRILAGENPDYVKSVYWGLAHVSNSELPVIGRVLLDQVYNGKASNKGGGRNDFFCRAMDVFDESKKNNRRIQINEITPYFDIVRGLILPLLEKKPIPKTNGSAATRAKSSSKLSHAARA